MIYIHIWYLYIWYIYVIYLYMIYIYIYMIYMIHIYIYDIYDTYIYIYIIYVSISYTYTYIIIYIYIYMHYIYIYIYMCTPFIYAGMIFIHGESSLLILTIPWYLHVFHPMMESFWGIQGGDFRGFLGVMVAPNPVKLTGWRLGTPDPPYFTQMDSSGIWTGLAFAGNHGDIPRIQN